MQAKTRKSAKRGQARVTKMTPSMAVDLKTEVVHETVKTELTSDRFMHSMNLEDGNKLLRSTTLSEDAIGVIHQLENQSSEVDSKVKSCPTKGLQVLLLSHL